MLHWSSLAVLVAGLLSVGPAGIRAQVSSNVVCLSSFEWMTNSESQNPCLVVAYLSSSCTGGQFTVQYLPVGTHYPGPNANAANPCQCSSVVYSTASACGLCQGRTILSWDSWTFNCTSVYSGYPLGIPDGTAVPQWAYQIMTINATFDVTLAQSVANNPESTASVPLSTDSIVSTTTSPLPIPTTTSSLPIPTTTSPLPIPTTSSPLPVSTSPSILPASSSSSNTNVGAIAGGVVGGAVGVALTAVVVVFFIVRKRRSKIPLSAQFAGHPPPSNGYAPQPVPPVSPYSPQMTQPEFYDPSDPSTFPVSQSPPSTLNGSIADVPT